MQPSTASTDCLAAAQWLAVYTRCRHEQAVAKGLQYKGFSTLFPQYEHFARWSDRIKRIRSPLFPGYVFVKVSHRDRVKVLEIPSVLNFVSRRRQPVEINDAELRLLNECTKFLDCIEPHAYLTVGQRVRIRRGAFAGWEGILVEKKNSSRVVIMVDALMRALAVTVSVADVDPISGVGSFAPPALALA